MIKERAIEIIEKFPAKPTNNIIYVVYNDDMIRASEELIAEVHGMEYMQKYVLVTSNTNLPKEKFAASNCTIYFDPSLHDYNGNGYN